MKLFGALALAILIAAVAVLVPLLPRQDDSVVVERAKAASFELGVAFVFLFLPPEGWEKTWPAFARDTGAVLGRPDGLALPESVHALHVKAGGTAWFFAQTDFVTYAMTNSHVIDVDRAATRLRESKFFAAAVGYLSQSDTWLCPNFSTFDEFPTCTGGEVDGADFALDVAVLRFRFGSKIFPVETLPLGTYSRVKPGTKTVTVGAGVGINDLVGEGQTLNVRPPYLPGEGEWTYTVPYDMNSVGGFSGSAVIDVTTGLVIGLHKGSFIDPRGSGRAVAIMIPMELIARLLIIKGYPVKLINKSVTLDE